MTMVARQFDEVTPVREAVNLSLADGATVSVTEDRVELCDREGRLLVRYSNGTAEISAPDGDLVLAAPRGRVVVRSATDIALEAEGAATVRAERVELEAGESAVTIRGQATLLAQRVATSAIVMSHNVERFELTATRLVEKTRDAFRDASDLAQTRVGRARTIVKDVCSFFSRRTTMVSTEDTSIDGSRVLLG